MGRALKESVLFGVLFGL